MNENNRAVVASILVAIDEYNAGRLEIEEVQGRLQTSLGLLERDSGEFASAIHRAEADLEEIRFTMLLNEQRPAATFRLESLRVTLESELEAREP